MRAQKTKLIILVLLAFLLSICAGLIGSALSKSITIDPQLKRLGLVGVSRDGWMESRAQIDLSKYNQGISKIHFFFDAWRPRGQSAALLSFEACGRELETHSITFSSADLWLAIPSDCLPTSIGIITKNPFRSADGRMLGVRLSEIVLKNSFLTTFQVDSTAIFTMLALFLLMLALIALALPWPVLSLAMILFSGFTVLAMRSLAWDNQWQLLSLALVLTVFSLGLNSKLRIKSISSSLFPSQTLDTSLKLSVFFVFLIGAGLRFYGTDFGLPDRYHPDEPRKASIALKMVLTGDLNPNYFLHPTLLLYLTALFGKLLHLVGFFTELDSVAMNLSGRLVSATFGSLALPLVFLIGRSLFSSRVGLIASAGFAFAPLHVTCSRYFKEDALLTFFVLLTVWLCVRAVKRDRPRDLLLAGFVAGLASSSKYSGMLSCVAIGLTPWLKSRSILPDQRFFLWGIASAIFVPVGFIIASPYIVLNYEKFYNHFTAEQGHMLTGHHKVVISGASQYWMYHFSRSIGAGATWPVAALAVLGFGIMLRSAGVTGLYLLALFCAFYFPAEAVNAKPPPQPERYILPCLPFLYIGAAVAVDSFRQMGASIIAATLTLIIIVFPLYRSVGLASELTTDTRVLMRDWVTQNIPKGSKILVDAQAYSAFLPPDLFTIQPMWSIPQRQEMSKENLKAQGINYILLTSPSYDRYFLTQSADQLIRARFEDIFQNWVLVKEIKSSFGCYGFSNPNLRLYKVED